jgi:pyruvate carboxylase
MAFALYDSDAPSPHLPLQSAYIDFPASVMELLEGRLGFPHRGFPAKVQKAILKGREPLKVRAH